MPIPSIDKNAVRNTTNLHGVLNSILSSKSPNLYVLNKTGKFVIFTVNIPHGSPIAVTCPPTWVPVDLALQVPKKILINSADFRRIVRKNTLKFITSEDAEKMFRQDKNVEVEFDRINSFISNANTVALDSRNNVRPEQVESKENVLISGDPFDGASAGNVNPTIQGVTASIVQICSLDHITPIEVYSELKNREESLTTADYNYLMTNLPKSGRDASVNKFIADKISNISVNSNQGSPEPRRIAGENRVLSENRQRREEAPRKSEQAPRKREEAPRKSEQAPRKANPLNSEKTRRGGGDYGRVR